jgi:ribokinase
MFAALKTVVVVGSINTDLVVRTPNLPVRGETVTGESFQTFQGGKGANQAVAAALLGANVSMIGKVGSDSYGADSVRHLKQVGVDCTHIEVQPGDSGLAIITVGASGENTIIVVPGANAAVTPEFIESKIDVIKRAGMVLAQLEIPVESVLRLAQICREAGVPLMLDPAPARELPSEIFALCEWITPNETEAQFYLGGAGEGRSGGDSNGIADAILRTGVRGVILKLGERGASISRVGETTIDIAPFKVVAVDTTAAGDTFNGAFATAVCAGQTIEFSGRFAAAAASISVTRMGAQASMPGFAEVSAMLA